MAQFYPSGFSAARLRAPRFREVKACAPIAVPGLRRAHKPVLAVESFPGDGVKILMSGGSGFVGSALTQSLRAGGHEVAHLVRPGTHAGTNSVQWNPDSATIDIASMEGAEAVVHLSGANIADGRWTPQRKAILRNSRVATTRVLVDAMLHLRRKPHVFVCASAIGCYGDRGDEVLNESSAYGTDFLALLTRDWEAEAARAAHGGIRTAMLRFGVILAATAGALPKIIAPIRWGVGGKLSSGRQWMSWVALADVVDVATHAIFDERYVGPINVVSPNPVRNNEFTRIAAGILHRPAILPAPAFALRLALGEMAQPLLLSSARVQPEQLLRLRYAFSYPDLESTLAEFLK
jgi:uncharacterized protein (TIGR01777 family)